MADAFWTTIADQLKELRSAKNADDVFHILSAERNPYGPAEHAEMMAGGAEGFFAGSGGDDTVWDALDDAGWKQSWAESGIYYSMKAPDGSEITYIEGDIYRGRRN